MWNEKQIPIKEIKDLLEQGYEVEVDSPDGFVPVSLFVDKGEWDEYRLDLCDGRSVLVNENHLFETPDGWTYAKDMHRGKFPSYLVLTDTGWVEGKVTKTDNKIPIVDIQVEHENHRYYTNGVSSHNTNVGKSLAMCHMAAYNLMKGCNVLYITCEMAEERIAERIDANLTNTTMDELAALSREDYLKKVNRVQQKAKGKLIIKEYPTASAHTGHFRHLIHELKLKRNFKPDIIYVDYINICASARLKMGGSVNSYGYIKAIAEELRGLAQELDLPIVTATQTTRSGFSNSDLSLEDTSESWGLPQTADFMFAMISSEELQELNQIMIKQLKSRYGDPSIHRKFVVGVDRSRMRLYNVEQTAQEDIEDEGPAFDKGAFGTRLKQERKDKFSGFQ